MNIAYRGVYSGEERRRKRKKKDSIGWIGDGKLFVTVKCFISIGLYHSRIVMEWRGSPTRY